MTDGSFIDIHCFLFGGNPLATLSWRCNENSIAGTNIQNETTSRSELLLQAKSSYNGKTCDCIATHNLMNPRKVSTNLNILCKYR